MVEGGVDPSGNRHYRVELDLTRSLVDDPSIGHNRWHPEIEPILSIREGDVVTADLRDGLDVQITPMSTVDDVSRMDMSRGHPLTGPFRIEGAEPGDVLQVEILRVYHLGFGFTCVRPTAGALRRFQPDTYLAKWKLSDQVAVSDDIPGVRIPAAPFIGVVGVAPSADGLDDYRRREDALLARGGEALPPDPRTAVPAREPVSSLGLRTVPPRENGGNLDVRHATAGARILLPVQVQGALLSLGDAHFAQGHGEVCSQAVEMPARVEFRCTLMKLDSRDWLPRTPVVIAPPGLTRHGERLVTTGIPVTSDGTQRDMDLNEACVNALLAMEDYLVRARGFTRAQAHVVMSVAVDLEILEAVNKPNVLVGASLDTSIFADIDH